MVQAFYWARLVPFNPKKNCNVRRYGFAGTTYLGGEKPVWYKVTPPQAQALMALTQVYDDDQSPRLFDIYTDEDRQKVDARENEMRLVQLGLVAQAAPVPVQTVREIDLSQGDPRGVPVPKGPSRDAALPKLPPPLQELPVEAPATVIPAAVVPEPIPAVLATPVPEPVPMPVFEPVPAPVVVAKVPEPIDANGPTKDALPAPLSVPPSQPELPPNAGDLTTAQLRPSRGRGGRGRM